MNTDLQHPPIPTGRGDRRALLLGMAVSGLVHLLVAWTLGTVHIGLPRPAPVADPGLLVFRRPVLDPPPEVRLPTPALPVPRPPPPVPARAASGLAAQAGPPEYVAHDVPPRLVNAAAVLEALAARYPDDVPNEAAGAVVLLWLFVDPAGQVTKLRLQRSSGFASFDRLAEEVAPTMAYRPALHGGRRVGVWVAQRIRFRPPDG